MFVRSNLQTGSLDVQRSVQNHSQSGCVGYKESLGSKLLWLPHKPAFLAYYVSMVGTMALQENNLEIQEASASRIPIKRALELLVQ